MVSINIQKKDLWLLSAIVVFLVGVGFVIATEKWEIHGHSPDEIEGLLSRGSCSFGDLQKTDTGQIGGSGATLVKNIIYRASSDGFVMVDTKYQNQAWVYVYTDENDPPRTLVKSHYSYYASTSDMTIPIKKENYWVVNGTGVVDSISWIPLN